MSLLLQILLANMAYSDDDESLAEAEVLSLFFFEFSKTCSTLLYVNVNDLLKLALAVFCSRFFLFQEDGSLPDREQVILQILLFALDIAC